MYEQQPGTPDSQHAEATADSIGYSLQEFPPKRLRGFALLDVEQRREIARLGGRTAHAMGLAHTFTSEEAQAAGRKGGATVSRDRIHMAAIGRNGGKRTHPLQADVAGCESKNRIPPDSIRSDGIRPTKAR